jgi:hypothetical protein
MRQLRGCFLVLTVKAGTYECREQLSAGNHLCDVIITLAVQVAFFEQPFYAGPIRWLRRLGSAEG